MRKKIALFCSSRDVAPYIKDPCVAFASLMGSNGYDLVWGGSCVGLMGHVSQAAKAGGSKIFGVTLDTLRFQAHPSADEMHVTASLSQRVDMMIEMADAFVIMPGGSGTLDEFAHTVETRRLRYHTKPIIVFNLGGFFDGIFAYFRRLHEEKLMFMYVEPKKAIFIPIESLVSVATSVDDLYRILNGAVNP
jgi:uncharacterized protein (TIGR00730 family)